MDPAGVILLHQRRDGSTNGWCFIPRGNDGNDGMSGMGISVGGGYEFKPNWAAGVDLGWGNPSDDTSLLFEKVEVSSTNISVGLHVSHLWY